MFRNQLNFIRDHHTLVFRSFLFILTGCIIVYFLPKEGKFKYDYQNLKGKPWKYEDLIAPFDFSIHKTNDETEQEKNEVVKSARPYFFFDSTIVSKQIRYFENNFDEGWSGKHKEKGKVLGIGKRILDTLYKKGILQANEIIDGKSPEHVVMLMSNNVAEERELGSFYTIPSASMYTEDVLSLEKIPQKELLLSFLNEALAQNVFYDKSTSEKVVQQSITDITQSKGKIQKGEAVISRGEIVDNISYQVLQSLEDEYKKQSGSSVNYMFLVVGQSILIGLCLLMLWLFIWFFRKDLYLDNQKVMFILLQLIIMVVSTKIALSFEKVGIYYLPFCILPIIVRIFYDTRLALFVHIIALLILSFFAPNQYEFIFIELIAGIVAIFSIVNMHNRSQFFITSGLVLLSYVFCLLGLVIMRENNWESIMLMEFVPFTFSALFTLFAYPLIFVFEKMFGFVSDVTLMELSDTNSPLLRDLASKAPGTFQHSLQVANLAEAAIYQVGGNPLLVRTGALYHDIGKIDNAIFFIENQNTGINPHDDLSFEESASIIINHVINGIEKARANKIPEQIIDFIRTHHGTTKTEYFLRLYKKENEAEQVEENKFRYPGPLPFSKETAVLMMADSVEASARSLKSYDANSIEEHVEKIIEGKITQKQFINADITMKDITLIKRIFKKQLMNIYHVRVQYPR